MQQVELTIVKSVASAMISLVNRFICPLLSLITFDIVVSKTAAAAIINSRITVVANKVALRNTDKMPLLQVAKYYNLPYMFALRNTDRPLTMVKYFSFV